MKLPSKYEFIKQFSTFKTNWAKLNSSKIKIDLEQFLSESNIDYDSFIPCEKLALLDILYINFTWRLSDRFIELDRALNKFPHEIFEIIDLILSYIEFNDYDIEFLCLSKATTYETSIFLTRERMIDEKEENTFEFLRDYINNYYTTQKPVLK
jgi:hypothetical protein